MTDWLDRALVTSPYYYRLCLSEKDFVRELKRLKVPKDDWPSFVSPGANATCHQLDGPDGKMVAIVCLGSTKKKSTPQVNAMLVHEAVHIWQWTRKWMGEGEPSIEFEAYSIQTLSQRLMESYERQRKVKR